jgi:hypothetical protein
MNNIEKYRYITINNIESEIRTLQYKLQHGWETGIAPKLKERDQQTYDRILELITEAAWYSGFLKYADKK